MLRDLNDAWGWIQKIARRLSRLEAGAMLENSSITNGRMRFIGGLLRVDSGGRVEIVGTLEIDGTTTINGAFTLSATSDWSIDGDGAITGDVAISGDMTVGSGGALTVSGSNPIVLRQESGAAKIKVGTAGEISGSESGIQMMVPGEDGTRRIAVTPTAIKLVGLPTGLSGSPEYWVGIGADGTLRRYPSGSGGPMGGDFDWPFSLSIVTSEFGMRVHPVTGVETMHYGIDFGAPAGANIPAASSGTVLAAGFDGSRGNYVILTHPNDVETHYFHMQSAPAVSALDTVAKGQTLGQVGSTGLSSGAHLHFEVHVDGTPIDPRTFAPLD